MTTNGQGRRSRLLPSGFATIRDLVTFVAGMGIIGHEVLGSKPEPAVLAIGLTMTGLPLVFGANERRNGGDPPAAGGGQTPPATPGIEPPTPPTPPTPPALPEVPTQ